jgi:hypothetical protein
MTIHKSKGLQFPVVIFPFAVNETRKGTYEWVSDQNRLPAGLPSARLSISKKLELTVFADLLELENNRYNLDLINLMYVATTRPEDALYILSEDKEVKEAAGWGNFLNHFCTTKGSDHKVSEKSYAWGDEVFVNQRTKTPKGDEDSILVRYAIGAWQDKIQIHRESNLIWDAEDPSEAVLQGKLVHLALSWINTKEDLPMVKQRLLEDGLCSAPEAEKIIAQIEKLLLLPELEACFKPNMKRYSERTLILSDGTLLRPDRVVETENETIR